MFCMVFVVLILLGNVKETSSPLDVCEWFCTITGKSPLSASEMKISFNISKRVDQKCVANTSYSNIHNTTTEGNVFVYPARKERGYHEGFSFVQFATMTALQDTFQTEQMNEAVIENVSCFLQPSNQTGVAISNGLDVLHSLRFYISFDNQSRNIPFLGYVSLEKNYYYSWSLSNGDVSEDGKFTLTSLSYDFVLVIQIVYAVFYLRLLTLFCRTLKEIEIKKRPGRESEEGSCSQQGTSREAQEQLDGPIQAEEDIFRHRMAQSDDINHLNQAVVDSITVNVEESLPEPCAAQHRSENMETTAASQLVTDSNTESEMVVVIGVDEPSSPVGIKSFMANKIFLNNTNKWYCIGEFIILIMFPISILLWIDVFVLFVPRLYSRFVPGLPPPYLTTLVFKKKHLWFYACFAFFVLRMFTLCFMKSSLTVVPSFNDRKHIICFVKACYVSQLLFSCKGWFACKECKERDTSESSKRSSIPDNIKQNICQIIDLETWKRKWEDLFQYLPRLPENSSSVGKVKFFAVFVLLSVGLFLIFIILSLVDFVVSLPIVSFCYGHRWVTVHWFENRLGQALFLFFEFVAICFSVVGLGYFLFCCSISLEIAFETVLVTAFQFPVETVSSLAIHTQIWYFIWMAYSNFTDIYFELLTQIFDTIAEEHPGKCKNYTKEYKLYIAKMLYDEACQKLCPVVKTFIELSYYLACYVIGLCLLFLLVDGTNYSNKAVLPPISGFLLLLHTVLLRIMTKSSDEKELKKSDLKYKVKNFIYAYFEGKID